MAKKKARADAAALPPQKGQTVGEPNGRAHARPTAEPATFAREAGAGGGGRAARARSLAGFVLPLLVPLGLPVVLGRNLWADVIGGVRPRAWDGAGHHAVAQLYSQSIFPDTFGWTHAYFAGMPFPNFYPPLYYWLIALLHGSRLLSFGAAFKLVTFAPVLLTPAALWLLGRSLTGKGRLAATAAALGAVTLLLDERFLIPLPAGLDYFSTFQIGLYTQPLGFVLLAAWYATYAGARQPARRVILSAVLLALAVLANFFAAATAAVFVATTVAADLFRWRREADPARRADERATLAGHLIAPAVAACLVLFWVVPMAGQYAYFVTKPYALEAGHIVTPYLAAWYALAAAGFALWLRRGPTRAAAPYLAACVVLAFAAAFAALLSPGWFPLQAPRFVTTLNLLLAVPAAQSLAWAFGKLAALLGEAGGKSRAPSLGRARYTTALTLLLAAVFVLVSPAPRWGNARSYYGENEKGELDAILAFARAHADGRYLVEVINPTLTPAYADASFDARALNSYLGAQGNETLAAVFHEASPNALFMLPAVNALSSYPDSFGVSSALADDLDFAAQPLDRHVERARLLGVKYVVTRTPGMKEKMAAEPSISGRHDFGWWSVYELKAGPAPHARALDYRPALVVSDFTLKLRRSNEWSFTRLAEEQFADGWFDVLLARSPEGKIDRLGGLDHFGALIVEDYDYDDEDRAYETLRRFAQDRRLILLSDDSALFARVRASSSEFPKLALVERPRTDAGEPMEALRPTRHYSDNPVRRVWAAIRNALDESKVPAAGAGVVSSERGPNTVSLRLQPAAAPAPVLLATTFHPNWTRDDGEATYAATPFHTLTFADGPATLTYGRAWYEAAAAWVSAITLALVCLLLTWEFARGRRGAFAG